MEYLQETDWERKTKRLIGAYMICAYGLIGIVGFSRLGLVATIVLSGWLFWAIKQKKIYFPTILLLPIAWIAFNAIIALSVSPYPTAYIGKITTTWLGGAALVLAILNGISLRFVLRWFLVIFLANIVAIALGYDGYLFNVGSQLEQWQLENLLQRRRYTGLAGQANLLAGMVSIPVMLLFLSRSTIKISEYFIIMVILIATIYLTASRTVLVPLGIFGLFGWVMLVQTTRKVKYGVMATVTMLLISVTLTTITTSTVFTIIENNSFLSNITIVQRYINAMNNDSGGSSQRRKEKKEEAIRQFKEHPLTGLGVDQFKYVSASKGYAHSNFHELAANYGIPGLLFYYVMYLAIAIGILRSRHKSSGLILFGFLLIMDQFYVSFLERVFALLTCLLLLYPVLLGNAAEDQDNL